MSVSLRRLKRKNNPKQPICDTLYVIFRRRVNRGYDVPWSLLKTSLNGLKQIKQYSEDEIISAMRDKLSQVIGIPKEWLF